jgi:hypothetical protein
VADEALPLEDVVDGQLEVGEELFDTGRILVGDTALARRRRARSPVVRFDPLIASSPSRRLGVPIPALMGS